MGEPVTKKKFLSLDKLSAIQKTQYHNAISKAFPQIISESQVIKRNWTKLENYFPEYQKLLISEDNQLIGFINTIPFQFNKPLSQLPATGWDWMFEKGITDFENNNTPNYLGGLQVIVRSKYQKLGYSQQILQHAKALFKCSNLLNLVIPIRPTKKHEYPKMSMAAYLQLKENNTMYDPWIRTHVRGGAKIIKVCEQSMTMTGDIGFWESILDTKIEVSGKYPLTGALSLISIDLEHNLGQYIEPNIWIKYK